MTRHDSSSAAEFTALARRPVSRRCALYGAGGLGAAAVLTACASGSAGSGSAANSAGSGSTAGSGGAASSAGSPTTSAGSTAGGSAGGSVVAALADVPVGGTATGTLDGDTVLLSQPTAGTVEAFSPVCPHQGGQVKPDGSKFRCSLHFSEFDLDGAVTKGPARTGLESISVTVSGTDVVSA